MAFAPGDMLTESLCLERELGSGAFGCVWSAEHVRLGSRVAVKILNAEFSDKPRIAQRFINEARTAAQIGSPHIVQVHDCNVTPEGRPYIVMEMLRGEDLDDRLHRLGTLPLEEMVQIVEQVCRALTLAHARGIVHRDIKPSNVFLEGTHEGLMVKLVDFGIAKHPELSTGLTGDNTVLGTPTYMSPEQVRDASTIDHRADLWSIAVVTYECLTGSVPFEGETYVPLRQNIESSNYKLASGVRAGLPPTLDAWFAKAFAQRIEQRFQTAEELANHLIQAASAPAPTSGAKRRDLAIGPTAPMPAHGVAGPKGTMVMPQLETIAMHDEGAPRPINLGATVDDPSIVGHRPQLPQGGAPGAPTAAAGAMPQFAAGAQPGAPLPVQVGSAQVASATPPAIPITPGPSPSIPIPPPSAVQRRRSGWSPAVVMVLILGITMILGAAGFFVYTLAF
jgi:serine/threonine-protein kinase